MEGERVAPGPSWWPPPHSQPLLAPAIREVYGPALAHLPPDVALWLAELRCGSIDGDEPIWVRGSPASSAPVAISPPSLSTLAATREATVSVSATAVPNIPVPPTVTSSSFGFVSSAHSSLGASTSPPSRPFFDSASFTPPALLAAAVLTSGLPAPAPPQVRTFVSVLSPVAVRSTACSSVASACDVVRGIPSFPPSHASAPQAAVRLRWPNEAVRVEVPAETEEGVPSPEACAALTAAAAARGRRLRRDGHCGACLHVVWNPTYVSPVFALRAGESPEELGVLEAWRGCGDCRQRSGGGGGDSAFRRLCQHALEGAMALSAGSATITSEATAGEEAGVHLVTEAKEETRVLADTDKDTEAEATPPTPLASPTPVKPRLSLRPTPRPAPRLLRSTPPHPRPTPRTAVPAPRPADVRIICGDDGIGAELAEVREHTIGAVCSSQIDGVNNYNVDGEHPTENSITAKERICGDEYKSEMIRKNSDGEQCVVVHEDAFLSKIDACDDRSISETDCKKKLSCGGEGDDECDGESAGAAMSCISYDVYLSEFGGGKEHAYNDACVSEFDADKKHISIAACTGVQDYEKVGGVGDTGGCGNDGGGGGGGYDDCAVGLIDYGGALAQLLTLTPCAWSPAPPPDERALRVACAEVLSLCDDARDAYDAALAALPPPRPLPPPLIRTLSTPSTVASSVSDDVFADEAVITPVRYSLPSSVPPFIFDDGITVPVPPPRRNKIRRNNLNSSSSVQSFPEVTPDKDLMEPDVQTREHLGSPAFRYSLTTDARRDRKARSVCADLEVSSQTAALSSSLSDLTAGENSLDFRRSRILTDEYDSNSSLLKVNIPLAKPVASFEFPATPENCLKPPSPGTVRSIPSSENLNTLCDNVLLVRPRKGSGSSDIAAWKRDLTRSVFFSQDDDYMQHDEWFSSTDGKGRVYYFEENSNVSSWTLPNIVVANDEEAGTENDQLAEVRNVSLRSQEGEKKSRVLKTRSMFNDQRHKETSSKSSSIPRNWLQLYGLDEDVLKHGNMNRTKITENGKKMSKKWASAYVVLTDDALCFYKDHKNSHHSVGLQPELSMQLSGARVESGEKLSSRKHVFLVTSGSLQLLCECENAELALLWRQAIGNAITKLTLSSSTPPLKTSSDKPKAVSIGRSKSLQVKNRDISSIDDATSTEEQQMKIRDRLKKFFNRRPTREILASKGIYKDEPVFDSRLEKVCPSHPPYIPEFVKRCINVIESREENMKTDGLYRASGNLSHVQKIRLQVDQNNLSVLESEEDVHVLTGALKLFFRELKEPLIPYELFNKAIDAGGMNGSKREKIKIFREIVKQLPHPNHDTLQFLLNHLRNVTKYQEFNRMQIPNLAIVFGPTLMWREKEFNHNIAIEYMQQNLVIEFFLQQFDDIFR